MKAVIQEEKTGCGIASAAALAGVSYREAKAVASSLGIDASDSALWSDTKYIRRLLERFGIQTEKQECPFTTWQALPDCALLSMKWHLQHGIPYWHWVVFVREGRQDYVLDSRQGLKSNRRTDFGRMKPRWYITVNP